MQVRTEGEGWRVEAFGMPPSLRAAGRVPPRLRAELQPDAGGATRVTLVAAPTLLGIERGVEGFGPRVADCLAGRLHTEQP